MCADWRRRKKIASLSATDSIWPKFELLWIVIIVCSLQADGNAALMKSPHSDRMKIQNDFLIYFVYFIVRCCCWRCAYRAFVCVQSPLWHVREWKMCNKLITADQIFTPFGKNSIQTGIWRYLLAYECGCVCVWEPIVCAYVGMDIGHAQCAAHTHRTVCVGLLSIAIWME